MSQDDKIFEKDEIEKPQESAESNPPKFTVTPTDSFNNDHDKTEKEKED